MRKTVIIKVVLFLFAPFITIAQPSSYLDSLARAAKMTVKIPAEFDVQEGWRLSSGHNAYGLYPYEINLHEDLPTLQELYDEKEENGVKVKVPKYENSYETMKRNNATGRFYPLVVNNEGDQMWVMDYVNQEKKAKNQPYEVRKVIKTEGLYNSICREYWFKNTGQCYMASDAVIHQIDGVLLTEEMTPWQVELNKLKKQ